MLTKLIKYSGIIFAGSTISGIFNFLFMIIMAKLLDPERFGDMIAVISLTVIVSIPIEIISNVLTKFVAKYRNSNSYPIDRLVNKLSKLCFTMGILLTVIFYLLTPIISKFLVISDTKLFYLIGLSFPLALVSATASGTLYGLHEFYKISVFSILSTIFKLIFALILIGAGLSTSGVIVGSILGSYIGYIYIAHQIKVKLEKISAPNKTSKSNRLHMSQLKTEIITYSKTSLATIILLAISINADILLTKHYFNPTTAGHYAALSALGKSIFYLVSPILIAMFPLIAGSSKQQRARSITNLALAMIFLATIFILVIFTLIPQFVVKTLFSASYLPITPYLLPLAIAFVFYAFARGLTNHFLALGQRQFVFPLALTTIMQIALIIIYHSSITDIVYILMGTNLFMFASLGIMYKSSLILDNKLVK